MTKMDAIILAGEKAAAIPVKGQNKAFLDFQGRPLVQWVVEALDRSGTVSSITVVGPRDRLEPRLEKISTHKPLKVIEQGDNIFDNVWTGALSTFAGYRPGMSAEELRGTPDADKAVMVITSDVPLLEPAEVDHFLDTAPLERSDLVFGFTREEILAPYAPTASEPGISYIYFCLQDRILRHSNLVCFRPLRLARIMDTYIQIIYRLRYQRHLMNVLSACREVARWSFTPGSVLLFFCLELGKAFHRRGWRRLRDLVRSPLTTTWVESHMSKVFQTPFALHETIGPGPTLDVDDDETYQILLQMYDKWKAIQRDQLRQAIGRPT